MTHPEMPGPDFTVIHNDRADVKLPHGWLPVGYEYWREGDKLHWERHSPWLIRTLTPRSKPASNCKGDTDELKTPDGYAYARSGDNAGELSFRSGT